MIVAGAEADPSRKAEDDYDRYEETGEGSVAREGATEKEVQTFAAGAPKKDHPFEEADQDQASHKPPIVMVRSSP